MSKKRLGDSELTSYWNKKPKCADAMDEFCSTKTNVEVSCTSVTDINNEQAKFPDSVVLDVASDDEPTQGVLPDLEPGLLSSSLTIGQTQSKKCNGYVPTNITSSIWTSYPFQLFQLQPNHNFVFENGSFHTR